MAKYSNQTITKDIIELNDGEMNYLGHNLKLIDCTINIRANARNVIISRTEFINCTIIAKKLKNFDWGSVKIVNCFFAGDFPENSFGDSIIREDFLGLLENCDFSHAKLDSVRFYRVDMKSLILPPEPYITILEPKKFAEQSTKSKSLEKLESLFDFLSPQRDFVRAFTFDSTRLATKYNLNEEESKMLLDEIDFYNKLMT